MGGSKILAFAAVLTAVILVGVNFVYQKRPAVQTSRLSPEEVSGSGRCIECHARETGAITVQFEDSKHAKVGVTCLDCHKPLPKQDKLEHHGFEVVHEVTAGNCQGCHSTQYKEMMRSRHGAPAFAAVMGGEVFKGLRDAEPAFQFHKAAMNRGPNKLAILEGTGTRDTGCISCHSIGQPNKDESIGDCSACHPRHEFSIESARSPMTCGRCHMGPDHAQLEIWEESTHGIVHRLREDKYDLSVPSNELTTKQQDAPTCATCHMSGLNDMAATHDVGERLSLYLFAKQTTERDGAAMKRIQMQKTCGQCHSSTHVERFYERAGRMVKQTDEKIARTQKIMDALYADGLLTQTGFDEEIEFVWFDLWHHYGRTAKHGAFMNGADYAQWHGAYPIAQSEAKIRKMAGEIRERGGSYPRLEEKKKPANDRSQ